MLLCRFLVAGATSNAFCVETYLCGHVPGFANYGGDTAFHEALDLPRFTKICACHKATSPDISPRPRKVTRQHHCNFANFAVATKSYNTTATSPFVEKGRAYNQGYFFSILFLPSFFVFSFF